MIKIKKSAKFFTAVEMEVNSHCNRKCIYCPISKFPIPETPQYMVEEIFHKIIEELRIFNFSGRISYHLYSEPLLRSDLEKLVHYTKMRVPKCFQVLFTNGSLLTDDRYQSLIDAGINHFLITSHDYRSFIKRENQSILFPNELILNNRGGFLSDIEKSLLTPCYAPSELLIITVTGDVILCCNDAQKKHVMGNVMQNSLEEIWLDTKFVEIRKLLEKGKRSEASDICKNCNDIESISAGSSAQYIYRIINK